MNDVTVQRNYKDTFFRMLFKDKENLLSLYNALNGTDYADVSGLEIMEACRTLKEYAIYVERLRTYAKQMPLKEAVEKAVDECIAEGILSDFLEKNKAEAIKVSIYEYDEELHFKTLFEEGHESGYVEGREAGLERGKSRLNQLNSILIDMGRLDDLKRATQDRTYQEQLMVELLPE